METKGLIMPSLQSQCLSVARWKDCQAAQQAAREWALSLGFAHAPSEEIALVVTELSSNLLKHARGGMLTLTSLSEEGRSGLQIESQDEGPGIPDVNQALTDGYSTAGSPGFGLGTVNRLMDKLEIVSTANGRTHILCRRWIQPKLPSLSGSRLDFGAATRPCPGSMENGDAFVIKRWNGITLAGVIDGLGHGPRARQAAQTVRQYVETHHDQPMKDIFRGAGHACRSTRGAVMALARFDSDVKLTFASIGNVEAYVWNGSTRTVLLAQRGILGTEIPDIKITECPWAAGNLLVMHSDGVGSRWPMGEFFTPDYLLSPAQSIASRLLNTFSKNEDDATVVTVKGPP
jgi:anti-sigma regulatory factor (Ser/Thr protein kinase)